MTSLLTSLIGWYATEVLGIAVGYIVSLALIGGGFYLAEVLGLNPVNPLARTFRFLGHALIVLGVILAALNYGKSIGAASCEAAWKQKNFEAEIARLQQESAAKTVAADEASKALDELRKQANESDVKIGDYRSAVAAYSTSLAACRMPTGDDDRRVCDITGRSAPGCQPAK